MKKDYSKWHFLKLRMERQALPPLFHEREVWWCAIGANIGAEEEGKNELFERPVIIVQKFSTELFWGIPLTSKNKYGMYYCQLRINNISRTALLSQLRAFSSKRLIRRFGIVSHGQHRLLKTRLVQTIINKRTP